VALPPVFSLKKISAKEIYKACIGEPLTIIYMSDRDAQHADLKVTAGRSHHINTLHG